MLFGGLIARLEDVIREETAACAAAREGLARSRGASSRGARSALRSALGWYSICSLVSCSSPCLKLFTREAYV